MSDRTDSERLDWLELRAGTPIIISLTCVTPDHGRYRVKTWKTDAEAWSLREAIDAAMRATR